PAWFFASYEAPSAPPLPSLANPAQVAAARAALGCGALHQITEATTAPLTLGRFASNFFHAWHLSHVKVDPNPFNAERQMCG
ncbi:MAG TPA: hypothetical protein VE152_00505, partial [Acidimicrobiales bacterium]|nr:hypothetical protein [Acidimicrobiales bacterium]